MVDPRAGTVAHPSSLTGRVVAPDLARGMMLLLIAVANAPWYLWAADTGIISAHPASDRSPADLVAQTVAIIAVDGRTYPMFAFLFGYGIVQLYRRQRETGLSDRDARRLLRRRHLWMIAFGAVHAALLWFGDIIGAYGLAGLVLVALFFRRTDRTIRRWIIALSAVLTAGAALTAIGGAFVAQLGPASVSSDLPIPEPAAEPDYLLSVVLRLGFWIVLTPGQGLVGLIVPVAILLAFLAARHSVLEDPSAHLPLLRRVAVGGIAIGWSAGALLALQNLGFLGIPREIDWAFLAGHSLAGLACGIGYVALFGVIAAGMAARGTSGRVASALQAVGKRSLTCYLAQSVVFAPLMSAWGLGLGAHLSSWSIALVAVATWLATVVIAVLLERARRRGPAEWALRRLAYRDPLASTVGRAR